jgi:methionyl aminopeptidase
MNLQDKESLIRAGQISKQVREEIPGIARKGKSMLQIAEEIESKILSLGGNLAFPVNLSINEIAAHHTPSYNDEQTAEGLLKVDFGISINGWTADGAMAIDLENNEENKKLIIAAETALQNALAIINKKTSLGEIGNAVQETMARYGVSPIVNLSGHSIQQYNLHAGKNVPNYSTNDSTSIGPGVFAVEPFSTAGQGKVRNGKPSGIYSLKAEKPTRNQEARNLLAYIKKNYNTLPFASRWLVKVFSPKILLSLKQLEQVGIVHQYEELIEISNKPVAQAERTILIEENQTIVIN